MNSGSKIIKVVTSALLTFAALISPLAQTGAADVKDNEDRTMEYLWPFAFSSGKPVRLYVLGNETRSGIEFPPVKTNPPSKAAAGVSAVREIFQQDRNVTVSEDSGIIRVWIGKVPTDLLRTKLARVSFNPEVRYDPNQALGIIIQTKEMQAAIKSLRLKTPWDLAGTLVGSDPEFPHLPTSINHVTTEQALDAIAKTWAGQIVLIYVICAPTADSGERLFSLSTWGQIGPRYNRD